MSSAWWLTIMTSWRIFSSSSSLRREHELEVEAAELDEERRLGISSLSAHFACGCMSAYGEGLGMQSMEAASLSGV